MRKYRRELDPTEWREHTLEFLRACCTNADTYAAAVTPRDLWRTYHQWALTPPVEPDPDWRPIKPLGAHKLIARLESLGYRRYRGPGGSNPTKWHHLALRADAPRPPALPSEETVAFEYVEARQSPS